MIKARKFAIKAHGDQKYGDQPYVFHLDGVHNELINFVTYVTSIRDIDYEDELIYPAAYLHDTIEDTDTTFEDIEKEFGIEIAQIVLTLTHSKHETYGEYIVRVSKDTNALLIKIADLFFNKEQSIKSFETATGSKKSIIKHRIGKYELALLYLCREIWAQ